MIIAKTITVNLKTSMMVAPRVEPDASKRKLLTDSPTPKPPGVIGNKLQNSIMGVTKKYSPIPSLSLSIRPTRKKPNICSECAKKLNMMALTKTILCSLKEYASS